MDAIFYRGVSRAWLSRIVNNSLYDANNGAIRSLEILQKRGCTQQELYSRINTYSVEINKVVVALVNHVTRHYKDLSIKSVAEDYFQHLLKCINSLESIITLNNDEMLKTNEMYKKNKLVYLKGLVNLCILLSKGKDYKEYSQWARGTVTNTVKINDDLRAKLESKYEKAVNEIRTYESDYKPEKMKSKGGCYIATAVYGDYDAPEVMTLRKFRDNVLKKHLWGRIFIQFYYAVSPPLARQLRDAGFLNSGVKRLLDKMVDKLNKKSE